MAKINRFEDLEVWKIASDISIEIFKFTRKDILQREYGIKDQIIRASISISNNIAEGLNMTTVKTL